VCVILTEGNDFRNQVKYESTMLKKILRGIQPADINCIDMATSEEKAKTEYTGLYGYRLESFDCKYIHTKYPPVSSRQNYRYFRTCHLPPSNAAHIVGFVA
jgi:hypothetical protein